jgi:hypothetical protein
MGAGADAGKLWKDPKRSSRGSNSGEVNSFHSSSLGASEQGSLIWPEHHWHDYGHMLRWAQAKVNKDDAFQTMRVAQPVQNSIENG